jgi:hypothetical protein
LFILGAGLSFFSDSVGVHYALLVPTAVCVGIVASLLWTAQVWHNHAKPKQWSSDSLTLKSKLFVESNDFELLCQQGIFLTHKATQYAEANQMTSESALGQFNGYSTLSLTCSFFFFAFPHLVDFDGLLMSCLGCRSIFFAFVQAATILANLVSSFLVKTVGIAYSTLYLGLAVLGSVCSFSIILR